MSLKYPILLLATLATVQIHSHLSLAQTPVGQSQELEAKNAVGSINRSQQAYHFERNTFASDLTSLGLNFPNDPNYSEPVINSTDDLTTVVVKATKGGLRSFSGAVFYNDGQYKQIICQTNNPSTTTPTPYRQNQQLVCPPGSQPVN